MATRKNEKLYCIMCSGVAVAFVKDRTEALRRAARLQDQWQDYIYTVKPIKE